MAHHLIIGFNDQIGPWVHARIPWLPPYVPGRCQYVGVAEGPDPSDKLLAAWFYYEHCPLEDRPIAMLKNRKWGGTCHVGIAVASPRWATRRNIRALFSIPFEQYNCRKVLATTPSTHARSIRIAEGLGMVREARLRHQFAKGVDALIFGMMRAEFARTWGNPHWRRPRPDQESASARPIQQPFAAAAH
ncbi:MAG: GNAT family N-acetyltransferase [Hyphomicrobiaceae bacterium]